MADPTYRSRPRHSVEKHAISEPRTAGPGAQVTLLGRPSIDGPDGRYRMRSRKSWALLAYLVLSERPPTRSRLAALLFAEADDPMGALRWGLAEVRRALGGHATIEGDPVVFRRHLGLTVDVDVIALGLWERAVQLPGLGEELLEGLSVRGAAMFESWLLSEQRRLSTATSALLYDAARCASARGDHAAAIEYAVRQVASSPFDEDGHDQLIRVYRTAGDEAAAARQHAIYQRMLERELGVLAAPQGQVFDEAEVTTCCG